MGLGWAGAERGGAQVGVLLSNLNFSCFFFDFLELWLKTRGCKRIVALWFVRLKCDDLKECLLEW